MKRIFKKVITLSSAGLIAALSSHAYASGYKLEFQSPSVLADAGEAAVVEDAGTNWYNSAGLVYLPQQLAAAVTDVYQRTVFSGTSTAPSGIPGAPGYINTNADASSYPNAILPAFHYAFPFKERYALGISVVPAWGLMEDYGEGSDVRYNLTKISTKTIDVSPSFAMKINPAWSFGLGPDFHYFSLQSRSHAFTQPITANDSISRYNANNWGRGWHAGVLLRVDDKTRVGLNYRSKIVMNMTGGSDFALYGVTGYHTDQFKVSIPLPPVTTLSLYHDMTPVWALMGTVAWDQWSIIKYYYGQNYIQPPSRTNPTGLVNVVSPQYYTDTVDVSVGTHYKLNPQWMLRGSLKFEPTPTRNAYRGLNFPDARKIGINLGARYQVNKKVAVDMIYAHVFNQQVHIHDLNPASGALSVGNVNTEINLAGVQLVWDI
ncbi:MAG TPA: outer membrane protein transport protein [Gammaproteobacteria bacterium]|nr:outer membrane protein transport protein [Gammaproteobacteria bacterium]